MPSKKPHKSGAHLPERLHSEGSKYDEDDDYLYNDFLELVTDSWILWSPTESHSEERLRVLYLFYSHQQHPTTKR